MVKTQVPERREIPGVTRDHLSKYDYTSPRRLEERAVAAPEAHTGNASLAASHTKNG